MEPAEVKGVVVDDDGHKYLRILIDGTWNYGLSLQGMSPLQQEWICTVLARQFGELYRMAFLAGQKSVRDQIKAALDL